MVLIKKNAHQKKMSEDLHADLITEFTSFTCYFENQEGTLQVAGHVVEYKSKYSDQKFDIPTDRIKVLQSKNDPVKLRLDKHPKEEDGKATDKNIEKFMLTFTDSDVCSKCKDLICQYMSRADKRKKQTTEGNKQLKLLASDRFLKKLYDEMVGGGIIKKEDFWAQRKYLISSSALTSDTKGAIIKEQREGLKNHLFCSDDYITSVQKEQETTVTLTKRKIQQIFTEHPGVYDYYKEVVPKSMNEKEFWAKFMKSYFFRTLDPVQSAMGNTTSAVTKSNVDDALYHFESKSNKEFDERAKSALIQPLVNLSAEDVRDGYGLKPDELVFPSKLTGFPDALKNLNRKSSRIIQYYAQKPGENTESNGISNEQRIYNQERERMKELLDFEDLRTEAAVEYIPLKIQDKNRYFEGLLNDTPQASSGTISKKVTSYPLKEMKNAFNEEIALLKGKVDLQSAIIDPGLAATIYADISNQIVQSGDREEKSHGNFLNKGAVEDQFREVFEIVYELLRHLWGLISLTKNDWKQSHTDKSEKIIQKLTDKKNEMKKLANEQTNQWIKCLADSINIGLDHFEQFRTTAIKLKPSEAAQNTQTSGFVPMATPSTPQQKTGMAMTPLTISNTPSTPISTPASGKKMGFSLPSKGASSPATSATPKSGFKGFELKRTPSQATVNSSASDSEPPQKKVKND